MLAIGVIRAVSIVLRRYYAGMTRFRIQARWRRRITDIYLDAPLTYHHSQPTGQLLAHTDNDVLAATEVLSPFPFTIGVLALVFFALDQPGARRHLDDGALADVLPDPRAAQPCLHPPHRGAGRAGAGAGGPRVADRAREHRRRARRQDARAQQLEIDRLAVAADELRETRVQVGRLRGSFDPMLQGLPTIGAIVLLAFGSWEISTGRINTGDLVQAIALFSILAFPIEVVGFFLEELPRAVVASARLERVVAVPAAPVPAAGDAVRAARPAPRHRGRPASLRLRGRASRCSRTCRCASSRARSWRSSARPGRARRRCASCSPRLADPTAGAVRIGGVDLRTVEPASLTAAVALVFQETFLFADTLWENVTLGAAVSQRRGPPCPVDRPRRPVRR